MSVKEGFPKQGLSFFMACTVKIGCFALSLGQVKKLLGSGQRAHHFRLAYDYFFIFWKNKFLLK